MDGKVFIDKDTQLGFSTEELLKALDEALISSIEDIKLLKERTLLTQLGEFPSEEKALFDAMTKLESLSNEEIPLVFIIALLKVIKANNDRIATNLEAYLKDLPMGKQE